jgi:hypothetical protein
MWEHRARQPSVADGSGHLCRHGGCTPGWCTSQVRVGPPTICAGLALAARSSRQPVVSDGAAVPAAGFGDWDSAVRRVIEELPERFAPGDTRGKQIAAAPSEANK